MKYLTFSADYNGPRVSNDFDDREDFCEKLKVGALWNQLIEWNEKYKK